MTDPDSDNAPSLQDRVHTAIQDAFTAEAGQDQRAGLVISWTLTAELAGIDGEFYIHSLRSKNLAYWTAIGMLTSHLRDIHAMIEYGPLTGDSDD